MLDWKAPERWAEPETARLIPYGGETYNLYNDLCRAVAGGHITGTLDELRLLAAGSITAPGIGPKKRAVLGEFLEGVE